MSDYASDAKAASLPVWTEAHNQLDNMREYLIQCRDEAMRRENGAQNDIRELSAAIDRIQPPPPMAINHAGSASAGLSRTPASPEVRKPW